MAGLVPAIHLLATGKKGVDARVKPGHDEGIGHVPILPSRLDNASNNVYVNENTETLEARFDRPDRANPSPAA
jgi:hypothetical protein